MMNCKEDTYKRNTSIIRHVFGNVLRLSVPLTRRTVVITDGEASYVDEDFTPNLEYPLNVVLVSGSKQIEYDAELHGTNVAYIEDKGKLPIGTYSVTILCSDEQGNPMRFKADFVVKVVDCTAEASTGGIGWYDGMDGESIYPVLKKKQQ